MTEYRSKTLTGTAILLLALAALAVSTLPGCGQGQAGQPIGRPDVVTIDAMRVFGPLERPPVPFPHDAHTAVLGISKTACQCCHFLSDGEVLLPKFQRWAGESHDQVMDVYHDGCLGCHNEKASADQVSGPVTCGECHSDEPKWLSTAQPCGFDKNLHHHHIPLLDSACTRCHHDNMKESSCRDCHSEHTEYGVSSFRLVAHDRCIDCHLAQSPKTVTCGRCHSRESQAAWIKLDTVPRLDAGQPDFVLISALEDELAASKMNTVPFSHENHEKFTDNCRVCHHQSLTACQSCHTLAGDPRGGGVKLTSAMHEPNSDHSCVGCHDKQKQQPQCAGCHRQMVWGRLSRHACEICHAGPRAEDLAVAGDRHHSLDAFRPIPSEMKLTFSDAEVPDTVTVSALADIYEPVTFPHRGIIESLLRRIGANRIGTYFHGHQDVVCQGCHHNSPISKRPPLCENCHGEPFDPSYLGVPGLYAAYHQQCIGCHKAMGITGVQDCSGCHESNKGTPPVVNK